MRACCERRKEVWNIAQGDIRAAENDCPCFEKNSNALSCKRYRIGFGRLIVLHPADGGLRTAHLAPITASTPLGSHSAIQPPANTVRDATDKRQTKQGGSSDYPVRYSLTGFTLVPYVALADGHVVALALIVADIRRPSTVWRAEQLAGISAICIVTLALAIVQAHSCIVAHALTSKAGGAVPDAEAWHVAAPVPVAFEASTFAKIIADAMGAANRSGAPRTLHVACFSAPPRDGSPVGMSTTISKMA